MADKETTAGEPAAAPAVGAPKAPAAATPPPPAAPAAPEKAKPQYLVLNPQISYVVGGEERQAERGDLVSGDDLHGSIKWLTGEKGIVLYDEANPEHKALAARGARRKKKAKGGAR